MGGRISGSVISVSINGLMRFLLRAKRQAVGMPISIKMTVLITASLSVSQSAVISLAEINVFISSAFLRPIIYFCRLCLRAYVIG